MRTPTDKLIKKASDKVSQQRKQGVKEINLTNPNYESSEPAKQENADEASKALLPGYEPDQISSVLSSPPKVNVDEEVAREQIRHPMTRFLFFAAVIITFLSMLFYLFVDPVVGLIIGLVGASTAAYAVFKKF